MLLQAGIAPAVDSRDAADHAIAIHSKLQDGVEIAVAQIVDGFRDASDLAREVQIREFGPVSNSAAAFAQGPLESLRSVAVWRKDSQSRDDYTWRSRHLRCSLFVRAG